MTTGEPIVEGWLRSHNLDPQRIASVGATPGLKTADFVVKRHGTIQFYCEVKDVEESRGKDSSIDTLPNKLTEDIHKAYKQLTSVNPSHAVPNVLAFVNLNIGGGVDYLEDVLDGSWHMTNGRATLFRNIFAQLLACLLSALSEKKCDQYFVFGTILVKDIPDFEHYDLLQKVNAIGSVSRFIVVDDSGPSGHLNEFELCRSNRWVMLVMRADGLSSTLMNAGASITSNVILETRYDSAVPKPAIEEATSGLKTVFRNYRKSLMPFTRQE